MGCTIGFRLLALGAVAIAAGAQAPSSRIGVIDFYGYGSLDLALLRSAVTFHEGDLFPDENKRAATRDALRKATGRPDAHVAMVCCLPDGRTAVFAGVAEADAPPLEFHAGPTGELSLPGEAIRIFHQYEKHMFAAVKRGRSGEDWSQGYALAADAAAKADQMKLRDWTRSHAATVYRVLETSRHSGQRKYAAQALGYAERSPQQIAALVHAAFDENEDVRNNATRALGVLCAAGPEVTRQIPFARFLPMLHSVVWTDRNKATMLFYFATVARDASVIDALRDAGTIATLREMAHWKDWIHGQASAVILGRIAGVPEERLENLDSARKVQELLASLRGM